MTMEARELRTELRTESPAKLFGLLGFPLTHSFSQAYFSEKFADLGLKNHRYELFSYQNIADFHTEILSKNQNLVGFNVTIPHKIAIIDYLDELDETARAVGAVNTVARVNGNWIGYNTDISMPLTAFFEHCAAVR